MRRGRHPALDAGSRQKINKKNWILNYSFLSRAQIVVRLNCWRWVIGLIYLPAACLPVGRAGRLNSLNLLDLSPCGWSAFFTQE